MATRGAIRERYELLDTANVSDVLDDLGRHHQALSDRFRPVAGTRLAGFAFTLTGEFGTTERAKDPIKFEACSQVDEHEVTIWSGGSAGGCYLGELIAVGLRERGCAGAVVEGAARDLRWIAQMGFPVFATERSPVQSAGRCRVVAYQEQISLPGAAGIDVAVSPGDFIFGDEDGVVVVPAALVEPVLVGTERLTAHEQLIRRSLADGLSLRECLARHGKV